jgi:EF-hand domain-containing protein 1
MNANKTLRYGCVFDTAHPEEKDRKFILNYNLADGNISMIERAIPNSGIVGGKFLSYRRLPKPNSNFDKPDYYTPKDFIIGAKIFVYAHRFVITSADLYVYRYMQAHPQMFSPEAIDSVRMFNLREGNLKDDLRAAIEEDHRKYQMATATKIVPVNEEEEEENEEPDRCPKPYIGEEEVKKFYHDKKEPKPSYMWDEKLSLPCNIDIKEDENIPAEKGIVRFLDPHEVQ